MKSKGIINRSPEELGAIVSGLYANRGRVTSARPNNEKAKDYSSVPSKSAAFYAQMSKRTNDIMKKSAWE